MSDLLTLRFNQILLLLAVCGTLVLAGCGSGDPFASGVQARNKLNIQKMANAYNLYASRFGQKGPKSLEEFKEFLASNKTIERNLSRMAIDRSDIDSYFISGNDEEPFDFRWDVKVPPVNPTTPVVFEKTGKDGVRQVGLANGDVIDVTSDKEYDRLMAGKVSKANVTAFVATEDTEE